MFSVYYINSCNKYMKDFVMLYQLRLQYFFYCESTSDNWNQTIMHLHKLYN